MDAFYEVDLLDDIPIVPPEAPMVRMRSMSESFSHDGSSGVLKRMATPIPSATMRNLQREAIREFIDYGARNFGIKPVKGEYDGNVRNCRTKRSKGSQQSLLSKTKALACGLASGFRQR